MVKIDDIICMYHQYFEVCQIPVPFFPLFNLGETERCWMFVVRSASILQPLRNKKQSNLHISYKIHQPSSYWNLYPSCLMIRVEKFSEGHLYF